MIPVESTSGQNEQGELHETLLPLRRMQRRLPIPAKSTVLVQMVHPVRAVASR